EISEQTSKCKASIHSDSSSSEPEESTESETLTSKDKTSPPPSTKIEPKECSNLVSGEVVTVILEPCPENGKKSRSASSMLKVAMTPKVDPRTDGTAVASNDIKKSLSRKRKLEHNEAPLIPSKKLSIEQETLLDNKALEIHSIVKHGKEVKDVSRSVNPLRQLQALIFKETPTYEANRVSQMKNVHPFPREMKANSINFNNRSGNSMDRPGNSTDRSRNSMDRSGNSTDRSGISLSGVGDKGGDPLRQLHALTYRRDGPISEVSIASSSTVKNRQEPYYSGTYSCPSKTSESIPGVKQEAIVSDNNTPGTNKPSGDEVYPSKNQHEADNKAVIAEEKLLPCLDCSEVFSNSVDLAVHARVHTKNELIQCTQCERNFVRE
ncbi:hypothetical protein QZH41_011601, partial [Actinostola sp. cb2023]